MKDKILHWGKLISITGSAQILIQAIGLISGILIIRLLPTQEYALYTIANAVLGTIIVLADGGIGVGVMSSGGKVWKDPSKLGVVIATAFKLRKRFAVVVLIIALPVLFLLLIHHQAGFLYAFLITLAIVPAFLASLSGTLYEIALKLHQDINKLQFIQVSLNVIRVTLLAFVIFAFPVAYLAITVAGLAQIWSNRKLKKRVANFATVDQNSDSIIEKDILSVVKKILPNDIYFSLSGQITIWLISLLGTTSSIAQVGALGRLATILTLINVIFGTLISPRFARMNANPKSLLKVFVQIQLGMIFLSTFIILLFYLFSTQALWILGPKYSGLDTEVVLNITGSCLSILAGTCFSLFTSRGWALNPIISILINFISLSIGILLINVSSLKGVFILNIFISSVQFITNFSFGFFKMRNINKNNREVHEK